LVRERKLRAPKFSKFGESINRLDWLERGQYSLLRIDSQENEMFRKTLLSVLILTLTTLEIATGQNARLQVATSFSILEDLVRNVGQDRVQVRSFVPRNGDSHSFEPGTQDVRTLSQAKLVFINGLGLEAWFEKMLSNTASKTKVITLTDGLKPRQFLEDEQRINDPHMWWDLTRTQAYITRIAKALETADPAGKTSYVSNAKKYNAELIKLDAWAKLEISKIPASKRKLVTNHDALGYFAARYGFKIIGQVIPSLGTEQAPSARELAVLSRTIQREGVKAIFIENTLNPKLAQTLADESGAKVAPALYTDSLGLPGSSGDTFIKAFRYNITTILNALKGG
jgi:zinc/manganese transport system substrate-binding protein